MNRVIGHTILIFLLCFIARITPAATNPLSPHEQVIFEEILPDDVYTYGVVEAIAQDSFGFIWLGARDGLSRYDGIQFHTYTFNQTDTNSLSNNVITTLFTDRNGKLWVGTAFGLNRYVVETDKFVRYIAGESNARGLTGNNIREITQDREGNLWIATWGSGVVRLDPKTGEFTSLARFLNSEEDSYPNLIRTIFIDPENILWIGTIDKGVQIVDLDKKVSNFLDEDLSEGVSLPSRDFRAIAEDEKGTVWLGSNGQGLIRYDPKERTILLYSTEKAGNYHLESDFIWDLNYDSKGNLWICTDGGGLSRLKTATGHLTTFRHSDLDPKSINTDVVRVFFEDNAGNYWIGHYNAPVNYVNDQRKKFYSLSYILDYKESPNQNKITALFEDSEKLLWIATDGDGIIQVDTKTGKKVHYLHEETNAGSLLSNKPMCIEEDSRGNIWIGHFEGGLSCYQRKKGIFVTYSPGDEGNRPHGNQVMDLMAEGDSLWIASGWGLQVYHLDYGEFREVHPGKSDQAFHHEGLLDIMRDSEQRILMASYNGFFVYDPAEDNLRQFLPDLSNGATLSDKWVLCLFEDSRNRIWLGTNAGLNLWKEPGEFECLNSVSGMAGNIIYDIQEDEKGDLWVSTNRGLTRFNYDSLSFTRYNTEDGLVCDCFHQNAGFKNDEGILFFGTDQGISFFDPDEITKSSYVPPVVFTGLQVLNKKVQGDGRKSPLEKNILVEDELNFYPGQNIFTLSFASLNYVFPHRNQYKYMLEDFDESWNYVGNQHWATYTNLPPGKYIFHVTASNHDGVWNESGSRMRIIVHPPFYKTIWFILLLVIIILSLVGYIYYMQVSQVSNLNTKLSGLVAERTRELESRNKEIAEQNKEIIKQRDLATAQRDQIVKQNRELEAHRSRLEELIEERTQDLVIAKEKAEEGDRLKTAFLENLSHQIRTPMNAIIGFINLLTEKIDDKYSREYYLKIINESGKNMLRLIRDIIDFSRMQTGQLQPEYEECQVNEIIMELITMYRRLASREKPDLNIVAQLPEAEIVMYSDRNKLHQIFSKLLENSVKFTDTGHISLGIEKIEEKWITFFVKDTGIGIRPEHIEKIFDRFFVVEQEDQEETEARSSGLGLAFAKVITEMLGGKIWAESKDGEGSSFFFTLPYMQVSAKRSRAKTKEKPQYNWSEKKILVAEDEESNYLLIEAILKDTGVSLIHCVDGVELLEKIDAGLEYDLVLLDLKMPRMGGINAMKLIRETNEHIPVIVQTAYDQTNHRTQAMEIGCNDFLVKPLRKKELLEVVSKYLG